MTTAKTITTDTINNESAKELYSLRRSMWSWYELANRYNITEAEAREAYTIIKKGEPIPTGKPATTLTPINPANEREIAMMMSKAVCAWANWATHDDVLQPAEHKAMLAAEYEATARCIAMFVREPLWQICSTIIETAKADFGIEHVN